MSVHKAIPSGYDKPTKPLEYKGKWPLRTAFLLLTSVVVFSLPSPAHSQKILSSSDEITPTGNGPSITLEEQVPPHYQKRYDRWKSTFLSVAFGRELWQKYAADPKFHLKIIVSKSQERGARVEDYQWDAGKLVGATITLGSEINSGYPGQQYYPVLGGFAFTRQPWEERPDYILAAAKIAHEFGHIDQIANSNGDDFQMQNELSEVYVTKLKSNGYDVNDPVLKELAGRIGGMPEEINGQREFWAETYSLHFLLEKLSDWERRQLLRSVRRSLETAGSYATPSQSEWTRLTESDCPTGIVTCR